MKAKLCKILRSKTLNGDSTDNESGRKIKLRTIFKGRGQSSLDASQVKQIHPELKSQQQCPESKLKQKVKETPRYVRVKEQQNLVRETEKKEYLKTQQNQEAFLNKLEELEHQAEDLIKKKILKLAKKTQSITLRDKGKDEISSQIEDIIRRIKQLQSSKLDKFQFNQEQIKLVMNRKIKLLQKLLAENSTQSEVLKKYFFAISAMNQKNRYNSKLRRSLQVTNNDNKYKLLRLNNKVLNSVQKETEIVFNQSCNRLSYESPKPDQYETYRYKNKDYKANMQPIPRSSYDRQFIIYDSKSQKMLCKDLDHYTLQKSRMISSTYARDFQGMKTQKFNYKDLDSYRNKIKNLEVSYIDKNKKKESEEYIEKSRRYIAEQLKMNYNQKNIINFDKSRLKSEANENEEGTLKFCPSHQSINTEFKSKFQGIQQMQLSNIKHRQLQNLKHNYKTLINN